MSRILKALGETVRDLNELNVHWALVGGFAVAVHGFERTTKDIDFAISVDTDSQAEKIVQSMFGKGYEQYSVMEHEPTGRLATVRLMKVVGSKPILFVDMLFASSGIEREIVSQAKVVRLSSDLDAKVASIAHLIAAKLLAFDPIRRAQDGADILELLKLGPENIEGEVLSLLGLITSRGFSRGKNLTALFSEFLTAHKST